MRTLAFALALLLASPTFADDACYTPEALAASSEAAGDHILATVQWTADRSDTFVIIQSATAVFGVFFKDGCAVNMGMLDSITQPRVKPGTPA